MADLVFAAAGIVLLAGAAGALLIWIQMDRGDDE